MSCQYFTWILRKRDDVWQADGRSNSPSPGRHSLETRDYEIAQQEVKKLDLAMAVKLGLADSAALQRNGVDDLPLEVGRQQYLADRGKSRWLGGVAEGSLKRYRAVMDKAIPFFQKVGLVNWNQLTDQILEKYAAHLETEGYEYRTVCLEITTIKQAANWMVKHELLPKGFALTFSLPKVYDTTTYCYTTAEVREMVALCQREEATRWLANVIIGLTCTGQRVNELASLTWANVDLEKKVIILQDESRRRKPVQREKRTNKGRRTRTFPIHGDLLKVLESLRSKGNGRGRVFRAARGGPLRPNNLLHIFVRDVIKPLEAKFPTEDGETGFKDGRLHSFRHYFCSQCANSSNPVIPIQMVMEWLGHRESAMVRYYYHLHDQEAQKRMGGIDFLGGSDES